MTDLTHTEYEPKFFKNKSTTTKSVQTDIYMAHIYAIAKLVL